MPDLPQPGHTTRVYRNKVIANNTGNFAAKGAAVASVPAGSGVVINSNDKVEIFDNDIADNQTANVIISSYFSTGYMTEKGVAKASIRIRKRSPSTATASRAAATSPTAST